MSAELSLCRAALAGDSEALRALDALIEGLPVSAEARQHTRTRALLDGKLSTFDSRGPLRNWLKAMAMRVEVDLRRASREDTVESRVLDRLLPPAGPHDAALVSRECRALLTTALAQALEQLPERDRLFVQHHHLDGLTLSAIGSLYGLAPSTVMRALGRALDLLRRTVREQLVDTHHFGTASLESVVRAGMV